MKRVAPGRYTIESVRRSVSTQSPSPDLPIAGQVDDVVTIVLRKKI
jgi:hypothetical protein